MISKRLSAASLAVLAMACSGERPAADEAGATPEPPAPAPAQAPAVRPVAVVGDSAVGCLELGAPPEAVVSACGSVADTVILLEGHPQPAVWVEVGGGRALAEIHRGEVWRIRVTDPALRTADAIGVGMPLNRLPDHGEVRISYEEGTSAYVDAHCGMAFGLSGPLPFRRGWTAGLLRAQPDSVRIDGIVVYGGCGR